MSIGHLSQIDCQSCGWVQVKLWLWLWLWLVIKVRLIVKVLAGCRWGCGCGCGYGWSPESDWLSKLWLVAGEVVFVVVVMVGQIDCQRCGCEVVVVVVVGHLTRVRLIVKVVAGCRWSAQSVRRGREGGDIGTCPEYRQRRGQVTFGTFFDPINAIFGLDLCTRRKIDTFLSTITNNLYKCLS